MGLKINVNMNKLVRLVIRENEKIIWGSEKIDQVDSFAYLGSIISKNRE